MQTDMHYYGTYCMARAAGLIEGAALSIATAAEYVDDSNDFSAKLSDIAMIKARATAHHPIDKENIDEACQREIWVPFHFIPGNQGTSLEERLICRKDSGLAREMVEHHLSLARVNYGAELIGITAHVYADTFSHYGFSGISSSHNRVNDETIKLQVKDPEIETYITGKFKAFKEKYIEGKIADLVGLGHGSVGTYPDRPYLPWEFIYEETNTSSGMRDNPATFLEACKCLYQLFSEYASRMPELKADSYRDFASIEPAIKSVLAFEGNMDERTEQWHKAVINESLFDNPEKKRIPAYDPDAFEVDKRRIENFDARTAQSSSLFSFLKAAKVHRDYVLEELLPKYELDTIFRL